MILIKPHSLRLAFVSAGFLFTIALPTPLSLSQEFLVTQVKTSKEIIVQDVQDNSETLSNTTDSLSSQGIQKKIAEFGENLRKYKEGEITRLNRTNRGFSIAFIVFGITLTSISTALGAVESQNVNVQQWTKFAIGLTGALAVAFQSLNSAFPVTRRAGEYAAIRAEITILEFKINDVRNESQLEILKNEFYDLIRRAGEAESVKE